MPEAMRPLRTVYHYCSLATLKGIVETKRLWLSSIYFLNDKLEHRWFRQLAIGRLGDLQRMAELKGRLRGDVPEDTAGTILVYQELEMLVEFYFQAHLDSGDLLIFGS